MFGGNRQMLMSNSAASFAQDSGRNIHYMPSELSRMHEIISKESQDEDDEFSEIERRRSNFRGE